MCGRFALSTDAEVLNQRFSLTNSMVLKPRYNIAPTQVVPVIRTPGKLEFLIWGLRPKWLKDEHAAFINARMETLSEKPAFRNPYKQKRCLIVANGYYEWKLIGKTKQPYFICLPEMEVFAFAGLWEEDTCTIITKPADQPEIARLHDRMPVMLRPESYAEWLNAKTDATKTHLCLENSNAQRLQVFSVTTKMNNPQFDFVECIKPLQ